MQDIKSKFAIERVLATFFGVGNIPFAPGTFASLAALVFAFFIIAIGSPHIIISMLTATLVIAALAFYSVGEIVADNSSDDPKEIVIDEVLGMFIAILSAAFTIWLATVVFGAMRFGQDAPVGTVIVIFTIILFLAFRAFDISKIGPVGWAENNFKGATGVILDDVVAGSLAGVSTGSLAVLVVAVF